jgi:hypothetical protein
MPIRNPRWLPPQVIILTQDHMGKYRNIFFSEAMQFGFNCPSGLREEAF